MLRDRVIAAAALLIILVPVIFFAGVVGLALVASVFIAIALVELTDILPAVRSGTSAFLTPLLGVLVVLGFAVVAPDAVAAIVVAIPLVVLVIHLLLFHRIERMVDSASQMIFALAYVAVPLGHVVMLRRLDEGIAAVFFVFIVICFGDVGAYFAGKYWGKHRFSKTISPSKTLEGLEGGIVGSLLGLLVMTILAPGLADFSVLLLLTFLLMVAGPLGDLCASAIKRKLAVKDFGSVIPGHGGVMDRADSLIFSFPIAYYYLILTGSIVH